MLAGPMADLQGRGRPRSVAPAGAGAGGWSVAWTTAFQGGIRACYHCQPTSRPVGRLAPYVTAPLSSRAFDPSNTRTAHRRHIRYLEMKTFSANADTVKRDWFVVDATDKTLGRLSTEIARRLRGKHKPEYTPHCDTGDYIVVINAQKVHVTGAKLDDKKYHRFTGYVGNLKTMSLKDLLATHPERVIEIAVKGMLPKNSLGREMYRKLKVYGGAEHPHSAQQPQALEI
jgi:large subunit ribosomal protein L13